MHYIGVQKKSQAFALPTVLIASVVLLTILAVSVSAATSVRTTLKNQYYTQLAQVAGESGVAYAKACLAANGNIPQWTDTKPLGPATDCSGNVVLGPNVKTVLIGGGGGGANTGGGGGGGGFLSSDTVGIAQMSYPVTVGGGGASTSGCNGCAGNKGSNSVFNGLTAEGGGYGGSHGGQAGGPGGSGGGSGMTTGAVSPAGGVGNQGNDGAIGFANSGWVGNSGGGGGAGSAGVPGGNVQGSGAGGSGASSAISGSVVLYAGGGGSGEVIGSVVGPAGSGGGGTSVVDGAGTAGQSNTGGGGGGGSYNGSYFPGGTGGSGIVIISYPVSAGITATGGTISTSGGNRIHKFTSSGTFTVTSLGTQSCPSDPRCSVTVNDNVRSSFSVTRPTLDADGRALTIPNNGYVEVTRTSNGSVWRTYRQPSVQSAVVPDLCSGNATATRGWAAAVRATTQDSLSTASSAVTITLANSALNAGQMYFRKDFNVPTSDTYNLSLLSPTPQDITEAYIDGSLVTGATNAQQTAPIALTAGCHTMVVRLTNATLETRVSEFTAALNQAGNSVPLVVTDTSWRVSSGTATHFSESNYYEADNSWEPVRVLGTWTNPALPWAGAPSNWDTVSGDPVTMWITTLFKTSELNHPGNAYAWFRNNQPFTLSTPTEVRLSGYCDDTCSVYLDGELVMDAPAGTGLNQKIITIQPGIHSFGIRLYNLPSANNSALMFTAYSLATSSVISRSDSNWDATKAWSTNAIEPYSYDAQYAPTPFLLPSANVQTLIVGGGGGGGSDMGGGGGGGGVIYNGAYRAAIGSYPIVVGTGGAGAPAGVAQVKGFNGNSSSALGLRAIGGGGGGSEYSNNNSQPGGGGSAGGSAGATQTIRAAGVIGQGFGSAATIGSFYPTGGGGAGGSGAVAPATGGVGVSNSILGVAYFFGGGGGGSGYTGTGGNGGNGGGGGGAIGTTTGGSGLNNGLAGGGGATVAQANTPGGNAGANTGGGGGGGSHYNLSNYGGNGGSGIVVIAYPTGSMTANGGTITTSAGYTIHRFNGSGVFTISSI